MTNEEVLLPFFQQLKDKKAKEEFVIDKSGVKTVELLAPKFVLDPTQPSLAFNGRKTPKKYVQKELEWYDSMNLNVEAIAKHASIWDAVASDDGTINSNYGYLIYHEANFLQYYHVKKKLLENPDTRQATMVYTRPSIHYEAIEDNRSDFICTFVHHFVIRNNQLISFPVMRSNDAIYGMFNDWFWFATIHMRMFNDLKESLPDLQSGIVEYIPISWHVYERHFEMLDKICEAK